MEPKYKVHSVRECNGSKRVQTKIDVPARVQTQFQEASDVNNIVRSYSQNPDPTIFRGLGEFQDNTLLGTYQESLDLILRANESFDSLPASTREYFKNDPAKLIQFMNDPSNYDEGVKLGLVQEKPKQNPINANPNANISENKNKNTEQGTEQNPK